MIQMRDGFSSKLQRMQREQPSEVTRTSALRQHVHSAEWHLAGRAISCPRVSPEAKHVLFVTSTSLRKELVCVAVSDGGEFGRETWLPLDPAIASTSSGVVAWGRKRGVIEEQHDLSCSSERADACRHTDVGRCIVYRGADNTLYEFDTATECSRVVAEMGDEPGALSLSADGLRCAWVNAMRELCVVDVVTGSWLMKSPVRADFAADACVSPDGTRVVWREWDDPYLPWNESRLMMLSCDSATLSTAQHIAGGNGLAVQQPRFSPNGEQLAYLCDSTGYLNVHVVSMESLAKRATRVDGVSACVAGNRTTEADGTNEVGKRAAAVPDEVVICGDAPHEHGDPPWSDGSRTFVWLPDSRRLVIRRNTLAHGTLVLFDLHTRAISSLASGWFTDLDAFATATDVAVVGMRATAQRIGDLCTVTLPRQPEHMSVEHHEVSTSIRTRVCSTHEHACDPRLVPQDVSWESTDGTTIHGRLYGAGAAHSSICESGQRTMDRSDVVKPTIVWIHGGPYGQSPATAYVRWSYFLERGWSVFVPDYRGSSGYGRDFVEKLHGRWGEDEVDDIQTGMQFLVQNGFAQQHAFVVMGSSAGGYSALRLLSREDHGCLAGAVSSPVTDLVALRQHIWRFEQYAIDALIGPYPDAHAMWVERSPSAHPERFTVPLLVTHGDADDVVSSKNSEAFVAAIRNARPNGDVELHVYAGEGHGFRKTSTKIDELQRTEAFFNRLIQEREGSS